MVSRSGDGGGAKGHTVRSRRRLKGCRADSSLEVTRPLGLPKRRIRTFFLSVSEEILDRTQPPAVGLERRVGQLVELLLRLVSDPAKRCPAGRRLARHTRALALHHDVHGLAAGTLRPHGEGRGRVGERHRHKEGDDQRGTQHLVLGKLGLFRGKGGWNARNVTRSQAK